MRASIALFVALASAVTLFVACSSSDDTPQAAAGDDAGASETSSGSSGSSGTSGGSSGDRGPPGDKDCTVLTQEGQKVDIVAAKTENQPEPKGGTPEDGKYVLVGVRAFADLFAEGSVIRTFGAYTLVVGAGAKSFEQVVTNADDEVTMAKGDLEVKNTTEFVATPTCEEPLSDAGVTIVSGHFTAEPGSIKMYVVRDFGITAELTFQKK